MAAIDGPAGPSMATKFAMDGPAGPVVAGDHLRRDSSLDSAAFSQALDSAYLEVAHWRKNCFDVPRGLVGKQFVSELARLFRADDSRSI